MKGASHAMPARVVRRATPLLVVVGRLEARPRHAVLVTGAGLREVVPVTLAWARRRDAARRRGSLPGQRSVGGWVRVRVGEMWVRCGG